MHRAALMEITLVLFLLTFVINGLARWMVWHLTAKAGGRR
jgi:ABC-type phosphate transport system permease subunit